MNNINFPKSLFTLSNDIPEEKESRISTIKMLLSSAREFSGRNLISGKYEFKDLNEYDFVNNLYLSKRFIGLMQYLIFLEVIGSIFQKKNNYSKENGIKRTLSMLSDKILKEDFDTIAGLRHSLVHKFSLCTENKGKEKSFCYLLIWDKENYIISKPKEDWNGSFTNKNENQLTKICLDNLIDHIEDIYTQLIIEFENNNMETKLEIEELNSRYTII